MHLRYRPDIDGLRALAVLAVIAFHLQSSWLPGGFVGVDVFFVISGFLITKIIYSDVRANIFSFRTFYQRRINRILPVFLVVCFSTFVAAHAIFLPDEFGLFLESLQSTVYFGQNIFFAKNSGGYWDAAAETMPLLHTWSLAVEEQFYIVFPIILLLAFRLGLRLKGLLWLLGGLAMASFTLAQFSGVSEYLMEHNYYSLLTGRAGEMLVGAIAGILSVHHADKVVPPRVSNALTLLGLAAIVASYVWMAGDVVLFPSYWALVPTLGAAALLYFGGAQVWVSRVLSHASLVFVGKISYSLYLWHWPVIVLLKHYHYTDELDAFGIGVAVILMSALAVLSYALVETPCRAKGRSFRSSVLGFYVLPALLITAVAYLHKKHDILYFANKDAFARYEMQTQRYVDDEYFCHNGREDRSCVFGDMSREPRVLVMGDSHAAHYAPYFEMAGKMYGFSASITTQGGCAPLLHEIEGGHEKDEKCNESIEQWADLLDEHDVVFMIGRWNNPSRHNPDFDLMTLLGATLDEAKAAGKRVVVFPQIPLLDMQAYRKCTKHLLDGKTCEVARLRTFKEHEVNDKVQALSLTKGVLWIDPLAELNDSRTREWPLYDGFMVYLDDDHMNEVGARQVFAEVLPLQKDMWTRLLAR